MQVLIAFLFGCFILGGTRYGHRFLRSPGWLLVVSVIVAASYFSLRVIQ